MRHVVLALMLVSCTTDETDSTRLPIVNGTRELAEPAVVVVTSFGGLALCSGTLITDRVVLTAKHCVQAPGATRPYAASVMSIGVGDSVRNARSYRVRHVLTTPGVYTSSPTTGLGG